MGDDDANEVLLLVIRLAARITAILEFFLVVLPGSGGLCAEDIVEYILRLINKFDRIKQITNIINY